MSAARRRRATHAGSWYDSSSQALKRSLSSWLDQAYHDDIHPPSGHTVHALIGPHAGYCFSGPTSAYAYAPVNAARFSRIFILGPSHHVYMRDRCAVTDTHVLDTPLGPLPVDRDVVDGLLQSAHSCSDDDDAEKLSFVRMSLDMDEAEHSIEMHLPFVRHVFSSPDVKVVPIVVGALSDDKERQFGRALSAWLGDGETFFVISSDFCHWGTRFRYTARAPNMPIWKSIENLDKEGMQIIEQGDHAQFCRYQCRTENTICGRHAIGILMSALSECTALTNRPFHTKFVKYKQSSKCTKMSDSSVSYASGFVYAPDHDEGDDGSGTGGGTMGQNNTR